MSRKLCTQRKAFIEREHCLASIFESWYPISAKCAIIIVRIETGLYVVRACAMFVDKREIRRKVLCCFSREYIWNTWCARKWMKCEMWKFLKIWNICIRKWVKCEGNFWKCGIFGVLRNGWNMKIILKNVKYDIIRTRWNLKTILKIY